MEGLGMGRVKDAGQCVTWNLHRIAGGLYDLHARVLFSDIKILKVVNKCLCKDQCFLMQCVSYNHRLI